MRMYLCLPYLQYRVQVSVVAPEIDDAAGDYRRGEDRAYALDARDADNHVVIEIRSEGRLVVRASIGLGEGRQPLPGGVCLELPGAGLRRKVNGGEFPVMGADIKRIAGDGRRGKEWKMKLE
jgi:hypothetical protein